MYKKILFSVFVDYLGLNYFNQMSTNYKRNMQSGKVVY